MSSPNCSQAARLIHERLDAFLSPEEDERLALHLADCPACRSLVEELEEIHRLASAEEAFDDPSQAWEDELLGRLADEGLGASTATPAPPASPFAMVLLVCTFLILAISFAPSTSTLELSTVERDAVAFLDDGSETLLSFWDCGLPEDPLGWLEEPVLAIWTGNVGERLPAMPTMELSLLLLLLLVSIDWVLTRASKRFDGERIRS